MRTLLKPALLLGLSPMLLLAACANERVVLTPPPIERTEPVAYPVVPAGEAVCDGAPCLSDRETGQLIADLTDAIDAANAKLIWLREWAKALAD